MADVSRIEEEIVKEAILEEPEEESKLKRILKRVFLAIIGLFMLFLILSYFLPGYHLLSLLEGRIVSATLQSDHTVPLKAGGKVIFVPEVYEELKQIYLSIQKTEFKVCLQGEKRGDAYHIKNIYVPETYERSFRHVSAELCDESTIIPLHSHPFMRCLFSAQDIRSYRAFRRINPEAMTGLMCAVDRFSFYAETHLNPG